MTFVIIYSVQQVYTQSRPVHVLYKIDYIKSRRLLMEADIFLWANDVMNERIYTQQSGFTHINQKITFFHVTMHIILGSDSYIGQFHTFVWVRSNMKSFILVQLMN